MKNPLVSVIMPVFNAEKYVGEAIESILNQTFADFEFLIFNDGSIDNSSNVIQKYASTDPRIVFYNYSENTGYVKHLNEGVQLAKGTYIARMDADDISLPERLAKQVLVMNTNPDIGICGTWFKLFGDIELEVRHPSQHDDIKIHLLRHNTIGHPTVLAKKVLLSENPYEANMVPSEDYHLWIRLSQIAKFHNLPEVLLYYRWHNANISQSKAELSRTTSLKSLLLLYAFLDMVPTEQELAFSSDVFNDKPPPKNSQYLVQLAKWINRLTTINASKQFFAQTKLDTIFEIYLVKALIDLEDYSPLLLFYTIGTRFSWMRDWSIMAKSKFVVKCLLGWKTRV